MSALGTTELDTYIMEDGAYFEAWIHGSAPTGNYFYHTDISKVWFGLTDEALGKTRISYCI